MLHGNRKIFSAKTAEIPSIKSFLEEYLAKVKIEENLVQDIILAVDEAATNIIIHAYKDQPGDKKLIVCIRSNKKKIEIDLLDKGVIFCEKSIPPPDLRLNLAGKRKGGFGVYLMRALMDKIVYSSRKGINITRLIKVVP